jgi:Ankyrin repeat
VQQRVVLICSGYEDTLTTVTTEPDMEPPIRIVAADDPRVVAATEAVQAGDLEALDAATDWPGHFPNGPAVVKRLVAAGADVNAHSRFSSHTETPLHWAASSDDVAVLDALLDVGADIEAPGAVLGGVVHWRMPADSVTGQRHKCSSSEARTLG